MTANPRTRQEVELEVERRHAAMSEQEREQERAELEHRTQHLIDRAVTVAAGIEANPTVDMSYRGVAERAVAIVLAIEVAARESAR